MEAIERAIERVRAGLVLGGPQKTTPNPDLAAPGGFGSWEEYVVECCRASTLPPEVRQELRLSTFNDKGNAHFKLALRVAQEFARGEGPLWLTLYGPRGVGKTHLAIGIAWSWVEAGCYVIYQQIPRMLDELRGLYDKEKEKETGLTFDVRFEQLCTCHLLVLDDLGCQRPTEWGDEKLDILVDWRWLRRLPTVVSTNAEYDDLPPRLADRLWDVHRGRQVLMKGPSYRSLAPRAPGLSQVVKAP